MPSRLGGHLSHDHKAGRRDHPIIANSGPIALDGKKILAQIPYLIDSKTLARVQGCHSARDSNDDSRAAAA
jgi:hypothetical protein